MRVEETRFVDDLTNVEIENNDGYAIRVISIIDGTTVCETHISDETLEQILSDEMLSKLFPIVPLETD